MKGLDPSSLGLVRKSPTRPDGRFTPVAMDGQVVWALDPKNFNPSTVHELQKPYRDRGLSVSNDCTIYVEDIEVKGFATHSDTTNVTKEFVPIYAGPNVITGEDPKIYADQLENAESDFEIITPDFIKEIVIVNEIVDKGSAVLEEIVKTVTDMFNIKFGLAPWKLNYHPTMFKDGEVIKKQEIDIRDLDDIDLNSTGNITVTGNDGAVINYPIQNLLSSGNTKITITHMSDHLTGFWYVLEFAGRYLQVKYDEELIQKAIISDYTSHMLENSTREIAIMASTAFNTILEVLQSFDYESVIESIEDFTEDGSGLPTGDPTNPDVGDYIPDLNPLSTASVSVGDNPVDTGSPNFDPSLPGGGLRDIEVGGFSVDKVQMLESVSTMFMEYGTRWAMFADLKRSSSNVGGDFINEALGQQVDMLLTIDYPVENEITLVNGTSIKGGQYAPNELHTFKVNTRFNGTNDLLAYVKNNFPGELVRINGELVFDYGLYNEYFNNLVRKGALLR